METDLQDFQYDALLESDYETPSVVTMLQVLIESLDFLIEYGTFVSKFPYLGTESIQVINNVIDGFEETKEKYLNYLTQEYVETLELSRECIFEEIHILYVTLGKCKFGLDQFLPFSDKEPTFIFRPGFGLYISKDTEC